MALVISDRIKETTNTVGTQTYQLEGAVTGFETFAANLSDGDTTYYAVTDNTNFEVGLGTINEGTSQTINYTVTVANVGGINIFVLNGVNNPVITFVKGFTYVFDVSDNTNGSHPLRFRTSADASYTDGVSISGTQGQAGSTVTIVVASDAPSTLKYYCTSHGNAMGNTINVISAVATLARTTILASSNSNNAVSFGTGAKTIFCTLPAGKTVIKDASNNINGTFVGNITGNVTGNVTGNASGTAATVTGAAQSNITSVGTLTGLTIDGDATFTGANGNIVFDKSDDALEFADDVKAVFGTGGDLEIYHNGSNSIIQDTGTGNLKLQGATYTILGHTNGEEAVVAIQNQGVNIRYNNEVRLETTSTGATVTGDLTVTSTADGGPNLNIKSNDHSDAADFAAEGFINFIADNDADQEVTFGRIATFPADITDGTEDARINMDIMSNGTIQAAYQFASGYLFLMNDTHRIEWQNTRGTSFNIDLLTTTPTASREITLPDATGTVLTTGNSDTPTTTTSSSDADFVLIDDGGTMKKITTSNLGITTGAASLDDATALAIALG